MLRGDGCTDYITPSIAAEARELAGRVAEWVADATIRLDERRKWVNELREENAKLRARVEEYEMEREHGCMKCGWYPKHPIDPTTDEGEE